MAVSPDSPHMLADALPPVLDAVVRLNQAHATELSDLDAGRLGKLVAEAFHASTMADGRAFLLAFDQDASYDSPNFRWFHSRYPRFVYVDRVAVDAAARGQGLASLLYRDLFEAAVAAKHRIVACEVNVDPPNPVSDAFHQAHRFEEVGRAALGNGKTVRYLVRQLDQAIVPVHG